ncbi:cell division ATP-binding protein FtsE [Naasia sp. SYSU D00057]|uniref:cell division ATP-binding protein FtsE n=1 Tax=Naasia sp. SYSU D00057 TaxID=2817380 RepID=UPI001B304739|nr:cell division ATP-binding protein FtsE [Naasia sp. SYSU D00057]
MIRFDRVTKLYPGNSKPALNAVDVEIRAGEFVFLVGASGSGKSSFLRLVLKEEKPSSGEIHVLGQRLASISNRKIPYFRRSLGVVFQDFRLLPNRTVYQNVAFTLQVIGKSRGFIQEAVPDVLRMVGLDGKAERLPHELSGGEQQRVAIARAVVNKPAILLADEPTGNLDPATSQGIMQVLELINLSGTTVVMATHDVGIVDAMKRRVIELVGGNIVRDETEGGYTTSVPIIAPPDEAPIPDLPVTAAPVDEPVAHAAPAQPAPTPRTAAVPVAEPVAETPAEDVPVPVTTSPVPVVAAQPHPATTPVALPPRAAEPAAPPAGPEPAEPRAAAVPVASAADAAASAAPETAPAPVASAAAPSAAPAPVSPIDETTSPRSELPLAARLRAAGAPETDSLRTLLRNPEPDAAPDLAGDPLSLAVRLGLRDHDEELEPTSAQEVGPTS